MSEVIKCLGAVHSSVRLDDKSTTRMHPSEVGDIIDLLMNSNPNSRILLVACMKSEF